MRIGTAGWSIPREFSDQFPDEGSHLERYSQIFNCVEINSTFYNFHQPKTFEKWASLTPEDFLFSLKLHQRFTHECGLKPRSTELRNNIRLMKHLGKKWETLLLQFPGKMAFHELRMARFYELLRKDFSGKIVVEPRNISWASPVARRLMKEFDIGKVAADPERCPSRGKSSYYRLHGSPVIYRSSYPKKFLKELAGKFGNKTNTWCIFDNTTLGQATGNALYLRSLCT